MRTRQLVVQISLTIMNNVNDKIISLINPTKISWYEYIFESAVDFQIHGI